MIGRTVASYHVVAKLGEGGMGSVWKAEDTVRGRFAALKFLPANMVSAPDARRRFLREANATSALDHPNIAALYEVGEWQGEPFFAFEFVDGETVADRLTRGPMPIPEALRIAAAAGDAIAHAHVRGIVHRDVTPRNIMLVRDGGVRVIDFGLAYREGTSHITSSDATLGTIQYTAPEVLRGDATDERSDLYGLGAVLYEMLTGKAPHEGPYRESVMYQALSTEVTPPGAIRDGVPPMLDAVVLKALAREPRDRFATAVELVATIRSIAAGLEGGERSTDGSAAGSIDTSAPSPRRIVVHLPRARRVVFAPFRELAIDAGDSPPDQAAAQGLADYLAALLAREPEIQVLPPAVLRPDDPGFDLLAAARREGANLVVAGAVRRSGTAVRLSFSLLDAAEGTVMGGDSVDGPASQWFELEDRLLDRIARALEMRTVARRPGRLAHAAAHESYLKAKGHLLRGDSEPSVDAALDILEGLRREHAPSAEIEAQIARACLHKFALTRNVEWTRRAERACVEALRLDPHSPEVLVTMAAVQIRTGKTREAIDVLQQSLTLREQDPEAYRLLSLAYENLSEYDKAEAACRRAIELRPEYWGFLNRYGSLLYRQGKFEAAIDAWKRVLALTPDNASAHLNVAAAEYTLGRLDEAVARYRRSLDIHPSASAWTGLGTIQFFSGEHAEAIDALAQAAALRPRDPMMWGNLADAQRWTPGLGRQSEGNFDRAIALVREHLELQPHDGEAWARLALWLAKRGCLHEALRALEHAMSLAPEQISVHGAAVTVYLLAGRRDRAREMYQSLWSQNISRIELERDPELRPLREEGHMNH